MITISRKENKQLLERANFHCFKRDRLYSFSRFIQIL